MILVTGGTGLVGSHLLYKLAETESYIRATFRSESKLKRVKHIFSYYTNNPEVLFNKIDWVEADITDIPKLTEAFVGITKVYHCAAMVSFDPNDYYTLRKINIDGTANIVNFCLSNNIKKLCYVSSIATVGLSPEGTPIDETCEWSKEEDHNVYAITKYGAEMEVWRGTQEGLDAVIVNPGIIVGPGFWNDSSSSLFKQIHKGLKYYTNGKTGYIDVFDVADIMMKLYETDVINQRYILIGENISFKDFISKVATQFKVKPPNKEASILLLNIAWRLDWLKHFLTRKKRRLTRHLVTSLTISRDFSNKKICEELNYKFKPIDESISEVCSFYLEDLKNPS